MLKFATMTTTPQYAWVTLVMHGDRYVTGAVVLAFSLRRVKTTATLVVLVTPDVSNEARLQLATVFDLVQEVPIITGIFNKKLTNKQESHYGKFMSDLPTKLHVLTLKQFTKVILMDADTVFQRNADHLFSLRAPAGIWDFFPDVAKNTRAGAAMTTIRHGERVESWVVARALTETFVCWGTTLLLEPSLAEFTAMVDLTTTGFGFPKCPSGFEEQVLAYYYYHNQWTKIGKEYGLVPWKNWGDETTAYVLHFYGDKKPWEYDDASPVYDDIELWRLYYSEYLQWVKNGYGRPC